jgi:hypothetical protein
MQKPVKKLPEVVKQQSYGCQASIDSDFNKYFSEEASDSDDTEEEIGLYMNSPGLRPNQRDASIQTSTVHFAKIVKTDAFLQLEEEKAYSTDWHTSPLYDDL